jgi:hypothetical protein
MRKTARPVRRRRGTPASHRATLDSRPPRGSAPEQLAVPTTRGLLERILEVPQLARVVPHLHPEVLHRVIQSCGLEDCGELVTLATPSQLAGVFDLDLWRADRPGMDEQFDAERFGVWLEVLVESGAQTAARIVAEMDPGLVVAALAQHVLVFDVASISPGMSADGEEFDVVSSLDTGISCEIGGYRVVAKQSESWDAIVAVLLALDAEQQDAFALVMRGCRSLSNSAPELDGLDELLGAGEQVMFDLDAVRERRREKKGYATPAEARSFLQMSRRLNLRHDAPPTDNPIARAYFQSIDLSRAIDMDTSSGRLPAASSEPPAPHDTADAVAAIVDIILESGVVDPPGRTRGSAPTPPRALLRGSHEETPPLTPMQAHMQCACDRDAAAFSMRSQEIAYLANTILVGCSIQSRPPSPQQASDAAVAVCNLGLENWPHRWLTGQARLSSAGSAADRVLPDDFLIEHDLVTVFQVGWTVLYQNVCMYAAERLIRILTRLRSADSEIQSGLNALRAELTLQWKAGEPWRAREALDVIMILDMPAWAALVGLLDEYPIMHAGLSASRDTHARTINASAFEFISSNRQVVSIHDFMRSLSETLES